MNIRMMRVLKFVIALFFFGTGLSTLFLQLSNRPAVAASLVTTTIAESNDYATNVLRDPWDMNEYSDISQYLNDSNQRIVLENISVDKGVFKASANALLDANFYPLFPGYHTALLFGKVGDKFPIDSSIYKCMHIAMKVESHAYPSGGPDVFQIFWFEDDRLNGNPVNGVYGKWGYTQGILNYEDYPYYPEYPDTWEWKIYSVNLSTVPTGPGSPNTWNDSPTWKGLRVDPTTQDVDFSVDWIRLTDCKPNLHEVKWSGGKADVYLREQGTSREYKLNPGVPVSSPLNVDFQGVAPGLYDILIKDNSGVIDTKTLRINQTFIASFQSPSFTSGQDYSSKQGNAWDFNDATDVSSVQCTDFNFNTPGKLFISTRKGGYLTPGCYSVIPEGTIADPKILLNTPVAINPAEYQYLSWRMNTIYPSQNVPGGMIVRLIWETDSYTRPNSGYRCFMVSQDMPFDVGNQLYTIDLFDPEMGSVEQVAGDCPAASTSSWSISKPILQLRLDPNENMSLGDYPQYLDQIWLTKPDQVKKGDAYPIEIRFNRPVSEITSLRFFWVNAASLPPMEQLITARNRAEEAGLPLPTLTALLTEEGAAFDTWQVELYPTAPQEQSYSTQETLSTIFAGQGTTLYLPYTGKYARFADAYTHVEYYPTETTNPGDYRVCVEVQDGYNTAYWCSDAVVRVVP